MVEDKTIKPISPSGRKGEESGSQRVLRSKISKNSYVFNINKKYAYSKNFLLKKKPETPMENALEQIKEAFSKKKPEQETLGKETKGSSKSGPSHLVITAILIILLFVLGGALYVFMFISATEDIVKEEEAFVGFSGMAKVFINQSEILTVPAPNEKGRQAFFQIGYSTSNLSDLDLLVRLRTAPPSTQAFLLNYPREGDDTYPAFRQELFRSVQLIGMPLNEIELDGLASLPGGATLIVPTGYFPKELLGEDYPFDYKTLLLRGVNIIYIGRDFEKTAFDRNGKTVNVAKKNDIRFSKGGPPSTDGFRLFDPQYTASGLDSSKLIYGSVSGVKYGPGTMFFLPQTIDGGWRGNGQAAAEDVVRIISEEKWVSYIANGQAKADLSAEGTGAVSVFTTPFYSDSALVEIVAISKDRKGITKRALELVEVEKKNRGYMVPYEPQAIPYLISGQRARLNMQLKENSTEEVKLYVRLYGNGIMAQEDDLELGLTNPTTEKSKDLAVMVQPGTYVVKIEDTSGHVYAATLLDVIGPTIEKTYKRENLDWRNGLFEFTIWAGGSPPMPQTLSISLDGKGERTYTPASITPLRDKSKVEYQYSDSIKPGPHFFTFKFGTWATTIQSDYILPRQPWDDPLVVLLAIMSVMIFALGYFIRQKDVVRYGLDIPDFQPLTTIKIPMKREIVLSVFDNVNAAYSWQYMPLRLEEIKAGFRRLNHNGKPILIGDFNLERVLAKLSSENLVREEIGYFGLTRWETQVKRTVRYLTIYRVMRNMFVNNAVKFTKLGAAEDCDVKIVAGKGEIYFHIMENPFGDRKKGEGNFANDAESVAHRALASAKKGTTIIIFATEEECAAFFESLVSASKLAVGLKMEINNGNITLLSVKNGLPGYLKGILK